MFSVVDYCHERQCQTVLKFEDLETQLAQCKIRYLLL